MANKYGWIFDLARNTLDERHLDRWVYCAYGVLEGNITEAQADLLEKLYRQDLKAQKEEEKLIKNKT